LIAQIDAANQALPARERLSLRRACALLEVSASGYYAWKGRVPSKREADDTELAEVVKEAHAAKKRRYGIRRLRAHLARQGRRHGERRLRRLARSAGLTCVHPASGPKTTVPGAEREGLVDFIGRDFVPEHPGEVLYTDITYIATEEEGWTYLVLFTDGCSRRIVSWEVGTVMDTAFVLRAFEQALTDLAPEPGQLVVHSDRGSQYTSKAFRGRCFEAGSTPRSGAPDRATTTPRPNPPTPRSRKSSSTCGHGKTLMKCGSRCSSTSSATTTATGSRKPWASSRPRSSRRYSG
jgi:putative transposase